MQINSETVVMETVFGSYLYGTNDENSDMDYKRIVIPTKRDAYLGRIFKSRTENTKQGEGKNTSEDTDIETLSIHYFFKLLCDGQTMALDILHSSPHTTSNEWKLIYENRKLFYTSGMSAFISYALHQAARYGVKGSRLHAAKLFRECLTGKILSDCTIPYDYEHIRPVQMLSLPPQPAVEVVGKMFALNTKTEYVIPTMDAFIKEYGKRAQMAEQNEGVDWKAVSHAFRACYEVREICETGDLRFPLKNRGYLLQIKHGEIASWQQKLEEEISITKESLQNSGFREKVNQELADELLLEVIL